MKRLSLGVATCLCWMLPLPTLGAPPAIPLHYDPALAAIGFPNPLVTLTIANHQAVFIVDTGAGVHTLASWFVAAAGLETQPTDTTAVGSTGQENRVTVVRNVVATIDAGQTLRLPEAIVAAFPPDFETHRIGGLVSPQLLAAEGETAVLDLRGPRLTFRSATDRERATHDDSTGRVCTNADSPFRNRLYAVPVTIEDVRSQLLIDSGATRTIVSDTSAAGGALAGRSVAGAENQGVGGASTRNRRVPSVRIVRGGTATSMDLQIGTAQNRCGPDGLIGMDALKPCVVVLGESHVELTCDR